MTDRAERDAAFAWQRGQSALAAGDADVALRWLDRAARIAPDDLTIALALAAACLERDNARAAALFRDVTRRHDVRQAWLGLAVAALRLADPAAAAEALGRALSRHVSAPDANLAADAIAGAVGAPGWCSVSGDGRLLVALRRPVGLLAATLDDKPLRLAGEPSRGTRRLPAEWLVADQLRVVADGCDLLGSPRAAWNAMRAACPAGHGTRPSPRPIRSCASVPSATRIAASKSARPIGASPCLPPRC